MSWRALLAALLLALGASAWGGVQLGGWLAAHAPASSPAIETLGPLLSSLSDAGGAARLSQPPQPLMDGTLGVPTTLAKIDWRVDRTPLRGPLISRSRGLLVPEQAREAAAEILAAQAAGPADAAGAQPYARLHAAHGVVPQAVLRAVEMPPGDERSTLPVPPAPPLLAMAAPQRAGPVAQGWQDALRHELSRCASLSFFERPTCAWAARDRYCGLNQAWGTIRECPRKVQ